MVRGYVVGKATVDTGGIIIITHTLVFGLQILRRQFPFQKNHIPIGFKVHRMHERGTEIAEARFFNTSMYEALPRHYFYR